MLPASTGMASSSLREPRPVPATGFGRRHRGEPVAVKVKFRLRRIDAPLAHSRSHRASALSGSAISSTEPYQYAFQPVSGMPVNSIRFSG